MMGHTKQYQGLPVVISKCKVNIRFSINMLVAFGANKSALLLSHTMNYALASWSFGSNHMSKNKIRINVNLSAYLHKQGKPLCWLGQIFLKIRENIHSLCCLDEI
jgi:hypothetical protein